MSLINKLACSAENDSYFEPLLSHFQRLMEVYHASEEEEA